MKKISNIKRMREILSIIKKHDIKSGLTPIKAREIIEDLGPTYVKLGQIMSMRSDLIPLEYCKEFEERLLRLLVFLLFVVLLKKN